MIILTDYGKKLVEKYIDELYAKRKEILDADLDTVYETDIPTVEDILSDIKSIGIDWEDPDGACYYNGWGVTDNYDADYPLLLKYERDFLDDEIDRIDMVVCENCGAKFHVARCKNGNHTYLWDFCDCVPLALRRSEEAKRQKGR